MNAPSEMNRKELARMEKAAAPPLEPDETVLYGVTNVTMPAWLDFALLGELVRMPHTLQKRSIAVVTERNIYVMQWSGFGAAKQVLLKAPLRSVESHVGGKAFPGRYLVIGDQSCGLSGAASARRSRPRSRQWHRVRSPTSRGARRPWGRAVPKQMPIEGMTI